MRMSCNSGRFPYNRIVRCLGSCHIMTLSWRILLSYKFLGTKKDRLRNLEGHNGLVKLV